MKTARLSATLLALALAVRAQVPDAAPSAAPAQPGASANAAAPAAPLGGTSQPGGQKPGGAFGNDLPVYNPGTEMVTWNGQNWNVNDNRLFQARFEKYLNAPEATGEADRQYQAIITEILNRLAPGQATTANMDYAFKLLPRAAAFDTDARICASLADAVYSVWQTQRHQARLTAANESLEQLRKQHEWNARMAGESVERNKKMTESTKKKDGSTSTTEITEKLTLTPYMSRLGETMVQIKANQVKRELSEIQAKVEFQALLVQLALQRRYQHVLIGTRFYRAIFTEGDLKLNLTKDAKDLFEKSTGTPPTVNTLDTMANEAVRDVRESIKAFEFLVESQELDSASKRLGEAFIVGEHMPEIRTLPREKKRKVLAFAQKSYQLISAIDVKDYTLAETLTKDLQAMAKDFDASKPMAAVETSRTVAQMHLAKARNAAISGDKATLETELKAAAAIWPRNPQLKEVGELIFNQGDMAQKAISDFDQLLAQKNYRKIFEDNARFIAATALYPERQNQMKEVMVNMQTIEAGILRAEEMRRQGNLPGAWESVERIAPQFPDDVKLNQVRADLTTLAADFVRTIRTAQEQEKRGEQAGSSLAWFLKAQKLYPMSDFAKEGIERVKKIILPDTSGSTSSIN